MTSLQLSEALHDWLSQHDVHQQHVMPENPFGETVVYAAVTHPQTQKIQGVVLVAHRHAPGKVRVIWEQDGPLYFDCPRSVLNRLHSTSNPAAREWRTTCREVQLGQLELPIPEMQPSTGPLGPRELYALMQPGDTVVFNRPWVLGGKPVRVFQVMDLKCSLFESRGETHQLVGWRRRAFTFKPQKDREGIGVHRHNGRSSQQRKTDADPDAEG